MLAEIFDGLKSYFFKASMDDKNALSQDRVQDTLSDKNSSDKTFDGQNFSTDKSFDTKTKFRHFCPTNNFVRRIFVRNF